MNATATTEPKLTLTLEERDAQRARCLARLGFDPLIPEATADAIRESVAEHWAILGEEFTGFRLTFYVNPSPGSTNRARHDAEGELMRTYGNAPHTLATEFTGYRLTFCAN